MPERNLKSMKSFLKGRRPQQFSDSIIKENVLEDRSRLEYHLETITNRNEEILFGNFCIKLLRMVIAPNLTSPTGPMGGGDGKVDSETYPVADSIALSWVSSDENIGAAKERWAFAFSTKAKWKEKLKSDLEKIFSTNRGYIRAYFVTSDLPPIF